VVHIYDCSVVFGLTLGLIFVCLAFTNEWICTLRRTKVYRLDVIHVTVQ